MAGEGFTNSDETAGQGALRRELGGSADVRAVRTRRGIVQALGEAIAAGGAVSVASVAARAGVGRSTFYTHFSTLDDVVVYAIDEVFDEVSQHDVLRRREGKLTRRELAELGASELFETLGASRALLSFAAAAPAGARLRERLLGVVRTGLRPALRDARPDADEDFLRTAEDFLASGLSDLLLSRVDDPRGFDDHLAQQVVDLLPGWLTG